jgi:hypothetical protein
MNHLKRLSASILIVSALLLNGASNCAEKPSPRPTPQSNREATPKQKTTADSATNPDQRRSTPNSLTAPPSVTSVTDAAESEYRATEEERHNRREETLEHQLVCFNAILAGIEVITLLFFFFTMRANIRAANAASESTRIASKQLGIAYRAAINIEDVKFKDFVIGGQFRVSYTVHNTGRVAATGV